MVDGPKRALVVGLGVSGQAAARHLLARGATVVAVDDDPGERPRQAAERLGVRLEVAPAAARLAELAGAVDEVVVSPGVPAAHPVFSLDAPLVGEVELGWRAARVPIVAVTGTNGKTTVVTLVTAMLNASGRRAVAAGNIGVPVVDAAESDAEVLVVEVSSFQLALTRRFRPRVGTWLNFSPDHLDWHPDLDHYRRAKARLWANAGPGDVAVVNVEDPVVAAAAAAPAEAGATVVGFGLGRGHWHVSGAALVGPDGEQLVAVEALTRRHPHDLANALAATATATAAGATAAGCRRALVDFAGLPHRVELVGEARGVRYYDDSKATTPGAVLAALSGFESVVLVAGGRNKGLDLGVLSEAVDRLRAVVAIGEAADEVAQVFDGRVPVHRAASMRAAVAAAADLARPGDAVVLSPGCASFDWYRSYAERGDDFAAWVRRDLVGGAAR